MAWKIAARTKLALATLGVLAGLNPSASGGVEGYYRQPTVNGDRVVFVCEGDLWSVGIGGGVASRMTTHPANEGLPRLSPDGKWLAFTADYEGQSNVYVMPSEGGEPKRLTFVPGLVAGWSPDSTQVYFRWRPTGRDSEEFLFAVPVGGGEPEKLPLGTASHVSYSPDGKQLAMNRWLFNQPWKNYKGGTAPQLWIEDIAAKSFRRISPVEGINAFPMWIGGAGGDRIYFVAHRNGVVNLCSVTPDGKDLKQHTTFDDYDVRNPHTDGKRIVFMHGADIWSFDVATGESAPIKIEIVTDRIRTRLRAEDASKTIDGYSLNHDGKRIAVSSRGQIWATATKPGNRVVEVASDPRARERAPEYSPDGKKIVAITDTTGEQELAIFDVAGKEPPKVLTKAGQGWIFPPIWGADSRYIAYADLTMTLYVVDAETGESKVADRSDNTEITQYTFSPDGRWLAYTKQGDNELGEVWLYSLDSGEKKRVSGGFTSDGSPAFDASGKYLYFTSSRHFDPILDERDFDFVVTGTTKLCAVLLTKDTRSPLLPDELLEESKDDKKDDKKDSPPATTTSSTTTSTNPATTTSSPDKKEEKAPPTPKPVKIDFEGIERRVIELPVEPGRYFGVSGGDGKVFFLSGKVRGLLAQGPEEFELKVFDLKTKKETGIMGGVRSYTLSRDAKRIAWHKGTTLYIADVGGKYEGTEEKLELRSLPLMVDVAAEWAQILQDAWRLQRDFYFAENMGGLDWNSVKYKYERLLPRVSHRSELNDLVGQMIGELGTSHEYVQGGDLPYKPPAPIASGLLGAEMTLDKATGLHRFVRVYRPETWETNVEAPLAAPHVAVEDGDYLLAINGRELRPNESVAEALQNLAGVQVLLTVSKTPDKSNPRDVQVKTLRDDFPLRYRDWCRRNREYVDAKSGGKLGYFHLPDMQGAGLHNFIEGFYPQAKKDGLVIDARDNHGGFVSQLMIQRLARQNLSYMRPRRGSMSSYPQFTHQGYKCVLINQHAGSDGDIFPNAFQQMKLGPLIGVRTWGGVIGIRMDKPFVDGGMSSQPEYAWWSPRQGWAMENHGVDPDIEVEYRPEDYLAGVDPQLDKAIEVMLKQIEEKPLRPATRPADPDRPGGK